MKHNGCIASREKHPLPSLRNVAFVCATRRHVSGAVRRVCQLQGCVCVCMSVCVYVCVFTGWRQGHEFTGDSLYSTPQKKQYQRCTMPGHLFWLMGLLMTGCYMGGFVTDAGCVNVRSSLRWCVRVCVSSLVSCVTQLRTHCLGFFNYNTVSFLTSLLPSLLSS